MYVVNNLKWNKPIKQLSTYFTRCEQFWKGLLRNSRSTKFQNALAFRFVGKTLP